MPTTPLPIRQDIRIFRGRSFRSPTFRLKDADGAAIDLTGCQIVARLAKSVSQATAEKIFDFTVGRDDAAGEFWLSATDVQTTGIAASLKAGYYDVEITDTLNKAVQYVQGSAQILGTVTP